MIEFKKGNLLTENTEAVVNPVNCVGVMGKGLALQFKTAYPDNFTIYQMGCSQGVVQLGKVFVTQPTESKTKYIINFPTKNHWRQKTNLDDVADGLESLVKYVKEQKITSISIPALGCGNGGLEWLKVKPLIVFAFESIPDVHTIVFEPF